MSQLLEWYYNFTANSYFYAESYSSYYATCGVSNSIIILAYSKKYLLRKTQ